MEEGQAHNNWPWRSIWKTIAPLKVSCFSWLVARKACLTHDNLQKRGVQLSSRCFLCQERDEDINHLFLHCKEKYGPKGQGKASNGTPAKPNNDSKQKPDVDINVGLSDRPPWFCSLCNTNATSKQTLLLHADGKKHRAKARAFHAAKQQPKQIELASHGVEVSSDNIRKSEIPENKVGEELKEQNSREAKNGNSQSKKKRKDGESENGGANLSAELDNGEVIQVEKEQETKHKKKAKNEAVSEDKAAVGGSNEKDSKKKIKWKRLITSALKSNSDGALKLKKLKKIVMKSANESGIVEDESQVSDMIEHKINSSSRFVVDGKYVRLAAKN